MFFVHVIIPIKSFNINCVLFIIVRYSLIKVHPGLALERAEMIGFTSRITDKDVFHAVIRITYKTYIGLGKSLLL